MKAFVYKIENGRKILPGCIVGPYATRVTFIRYGLRHLKPGEYKVEQPVTWERRFSLDPKDSVVWTYWRDDQK